MNPEKHESKTFSYVNGGEYGFQSSMRTGLKTIQSEVKIHHPLESLASDYDLNLKRMNYTMLRHSQGLHAPLKLQMEMNLVNQAFTRLPCLPSSNLAQDILQGNDETIGPENVFGYRNESEVMGDPHMMMEHKLGLKPL